MSTSRTLIAALRFQGGAVIAADSQASDSAALVRWPIEKLERVGSHPCVVGLSGSVARGQAARSKLEALRLHTNTFDKWERVRNAVATCLSPIYREIKQANDTAQREIYQTALWGLLVYWAEGEPHILECGLNGDIEHHEHFHAIGSAAKTAYAVYRTLGGKRLCSLEERRALLVMLRILRTCVAVELFGVSEPLSAWVLSEGKATKVSPDVIQAKLQAVDEWEEKDRSALLGDIQLSPHLNGYA